MNRTKRYQFHIRELLYLAASVSAVCAIILWIAAATEDKPHLTTSCQAKMKSIGYGILMYSVKHGELPPASVQDADGNALHSWRVLILPYIGHEDVFEQYNFDEPWDSPGNLALARKYPYLYRCPANRNAKVTATANYFVVIGSRTPWSQDLSTTLKSIREWNRLDKTALVVEVQGSDVLWTEPRDLELSDICSISSNHQGVNFFFADGSCRAISENLDLNEIKKMIVFENPNSE